MSGAFDQDFNDPVVAAYDELRNMPEKRFLSLRMPGDPGLRDQVLTAKQHIDLRPALARCQRMP